MKGAILEKIGAPLLVSEIILPENLRRGQVLVRVLCSGICGAQLREIDGTKGDPAHLPHLLGHEGSGIVTGIGEGVSTVAIGDKVVLHWRKGEGYDVGGLQGSTKAGPITTFSEYSIVSENRVTKIPDDVPNDLAALFGCALSTALAVVDNEAKVKQGELVLVIGCGGLGLALILASRMRDAEVHATDIHNKRDLVQSFGGQFVHIYGKVDQVYDVIIDTTGTYKASESYRYISLQKGGSEGGGFQPDKDIPRYVDMWRHGKLKDYAKLITHRIKLDQINEGIELMRAGKAGRVMIEMNGQ